MKHLFDEALSHVLAHEGGFSNHPRDPGGATNRGVTQRTYDTWRRRTGKARRSVRHIGDDEVAAIYRSDYWNAIRGDELPPGVDYAVFDFAVNSGPKRAARFLQRVVGVDDDGIVGPATLAATRAAAASGIIKTLQDDRLAFLKHLDTWPVFGRGWSRRIEAVRARALSMSARPDPAVPRGTVPTPSTSNEARARWWAALVRLLLASFMKGRRP